jgi:hypothetical protein
MWYLTFEGDTGLHDWVDRAQRRLRDLPMVDLVPNAWLHGTVDDVGFLDELAPETVERVGEAGEQALRGWTTPPLVLGPLQPMKDALVLHAEPVEELSELRRRLRAATVTVLGAEALPPLEVFEPHVSIAYVNHPTDDAPLLGRVADVRAERVAVAPPVVRLVSVTRRDRHYQWTERWVPTVTRAG